MRSTSPPSTFTSETTDRDARCLADAPRVVLDRNEAAVATTTGLNNRGAIADAKHAVAMPLPRAGPQAAVPQGGPRLGHVVVRRLGEYSLEAEFLVL